VDQLNGDNLIIIGNMFNPVQSCTINTIYNPAMPNYPIPTFTLRNNQEINNIKIIDELEYQTNPMNYLVIDENDFLHNFQTDTISC
jgi:hypothetical protein